MNHSEDVMQNILHLFHIYAEKEWHKHKLYVEYVKLKKDNCITGNNLKHVL